MCWLTPGRMGSPLSGPCCLWLVGKSRQTGVLLQGIKGREAVVGQPLLLIGLAGQKPGDLIGISGICYQNAALTVGLGTGAESSSPLS